MENVIREDLHKIVKEIKLGTVKTRYATRKVCSVTFINDASVEFTDTEGLVDLQLACKKCGVDAFKSIKLVEEEQKNSDDSDNENSKYICVLFETTDGDKYRLFPSRRADKASINVYYNALINKVRDKQ